MGNMDSERHHSDNFVNINQLLRNVMVYRTEKRGFLRYDVIRIINDWCVDIFLRSDQDLPFPTTTKGTTTNPDCSRLIITPFCVRCLSNVCRSKSCKLRHQKKG